MKKRLIALVMCCFLAINVFSSTVFAAQNTEDIVILYENDVHCAVEGYSKLSAMKKELQEAYAHVGVVSCGDYIQGSSLGVISQGEYIVNLMNLVGYDAAALGNHEFDYRLERLEELVGMMETKPICCNFEKIGEGQPYFAPYSIVSYGDVDIAYIGITTPSTIISSSPMQFKDDNGAYVYTFQSDALYEVVQGYIDSAKAEGADYIIALSHIGYVEDAVAATDDVETLIQNTVGLDVVLDAHSHTVIESKTVTDKSGNEVLLSSTGTKFEYMGKLTISEGTFKTELIKTEEYSLTDPAVDAYILQLEEENAVLGARKVAHTDFDLITHDADGNRLVRTGETNLGDLGADAFRYAVNADIGYVNGGGLRASIEAGEITFNELLDVFPFNDMIVLAEVSGQTIKDMLEMTVMSWPEEDGCFPHVSGITFSVNTQIPTSVQINEQEEFMTVAGEYRVYDIKVYNRETEVYEAIDLNATYTIAASDYYILEYGSGMRMFEEAVVLQNDGLLDVEALEKYVTEQLVGVIGEEYQDMTPNITFTEGEVVAVEETEPAHSNIYVVLGAIAALAVIVLVMKLGRKRNV